MQQDDLKNNSGNSISFRHHHTWINPSKSKEEGCRIGVDKTIKDECYVYQIPEEVFTDKNNWHNDIFSYSTNVNSKLLEATVVVGETIFWKISQYND